MVFSSSCTVYGQPAELPVTGRHRISNATSPYGFTKVMCERILRDVTQANPGLRVVMLRYFNPIGAHPSGRIGELAHRGAEQPGAFRHANRRWAAEQLTVNGSRLRHTRWHLRAGLHPRGGSGQRACDRSRPCRDEATPGCEVFNLGTGKGNTVLEVVKAFKEVTGVDVPYTIGPRRPGDVESVYADTTKSREVLGWTCKYDLRDALRDAWNWEQALAQWQGEAQHHREVGAQRTEQRAGQHLALRVVAGAGGPCPRAREDDQTGQ